jgi:hypothetical protein
MPGIVKIGSTKLKPEHRARQLSTTGVPAPFQVIARYRFDDELSAERELQAIFSCRRVHPRREFFKATVEEAREALLCLNRGSFFVAKPKPVSHSPHAFLDCLNVLPIEVRLQIYPYLLKGVLDKLEAK